MKSEQKAALAAYVAVAAVGLVVVNQSVGHDPLGLGRVYSSLDHVVVGGQLHPAEPATSSTPFGGPHGRESSVASASNALVANQPPVVGTRQTTTLSSTSAVTTNVAGGGPRPASDGPQRAVGQAMVRHLATGAGHPTHQLTASPSGGHDGFGHPDHSPVTTAGPARAPGGSPQARDGSGDRNNYAHGQPGTSRGPDGDGSGSEQDDPHGLLPDPLGWLHPAITAPAVKPIALSVAFTTSPDLAPTYSGALEPSSAPVESVEEQSDLSAPQPSADDYRGPRGCDNAQAGPRHRAFGAVGPQAGKPDGPRHRAETGSGHAHSRSPYGSGFGHH